VTKSPEGRLLDLVADVQGLLDIDEFREGLLEALHRAVPSDWVSLNDVGPGPNNVVAIVRPELDPKWLDVFGRLVHENPLVRRLQETRDGRAYRITDVVSQEEYRSLAIYREFYGIIGVEYQMAFTLPHSQDRILGVALSRKHENYTDAERDFVNHARHFLIQAYRNAVEFERARTIHGSTGAALLYSLQSKGLTNREAEVVRYVALGRSNRDAATALGISERTIGKHLERAFKKLGVANRSAASGLVWELADEWPRLRPHQRV
jgi:DNA-binding CsgD family transcriptional regulator